MIYSLPQQWGGENCLIPVDRNLVELVMEQMGGEEVIRFVSIEFATHAEQALADVGLGVDGITFQNVWQVYLALIPRM